MGTKTFLKDKDWKEIEEDVCLLHKLNTTKSNSKYLPYASIEFENKKVAGFATAFITNKHDFENLN